MARYRSRAITHRFSMLAVTHSTSVAVQKLHIVFPNFQVPSKMLVELNGTTNTPMMRSATASEAMKKLVTVCSRLKRRMAVITITLPADKMSDGTKRFKSDISLF